VDTPWRLAEAIQTSRAGKSKANPYHSGVRIPSKQVISDLTLSCLHTKKPLQAERLGETDVTPQTESLVELMFCGYLTNASQESLTTR
jgi:hypothetical protein